MGDEVAGWRGACVENGLGLRITCGKAMEAGHNTAGRTSSGHVVQALQSGQLAAGAPTRTLEFSLLVSTCVALLT